MRSQARNALVFATLFLAGGVDAQVNPGDISNMADDLQRIQIRMAQGDKSAYAAQQKQLKVMDASAISLCMDNNLPIVVFNMRKPGNIARVVTSDSGIGTRVCLEKP